eukprot:evm.model.scf_388.6 EVM.evm.TU.scf_388.6   scf_388:61491-71525(-)
MAPWSRKGSDTVALAACLLLCCLQALPLGGGLDTETGGTYRRRLLQSGGANDTVVFDGADGASLNETVGGLGDGQTLSLEVPLVALDGPLAVDGAGVTLRGQLGGQRTVLACARRQPALLLSGSITIRDIVITNCTTSSSLVLTSSSVVFQNVVFENNTAMGIPDFDISFVDTDAAESGGAIRADVNTTVTVIDSEFSSNEASQGGAIYTAGSLLVNDSVFEDNVAVFGGGGAIKSNAGTANFQDADVFSGNASNEFVLRGCQFMRNSAPNGNKVDPLTSRSGAPIEKNQFFDSFGNPSFTGGAILIRDLGTVEIDDCDFENNTASTGGAIYFNMDDLGLVGSPPHRIQGCTFTGNRADLSDASISHGGAVFVVSLDTAVRPVIADSRFRSNKANFGGALHILTASQSAMEVSGCLFEGNQADTAGGAVLARNIENLVWDANNLTRNQAEMGGGLMLTNAAQLMVQGVNLDIDTTTGLVFIPSGGGMKSMFEENIAFDGGGLMCYGCGATSIQSAEFRSNRASGNGGGLSFVDSTPGGGIDLNTVILEDNLATFGGAVFMESASNFKLQAADEDVQHSLIRGNKAMVGGGLFLALKGPLKNRVEIFNTELSNNSALELEQLEAELANDALFQLGDLRIREKFGTGRESPDFFTRCAEGGGGGACIVMSQIPQRAGAELTVLDSTFSNNSALNGGGLFISIHGGPWSSEGCTSQTVTSVPCRSARFVGARVTDNFAEFGGGGAFVTEPQSVFATCPGLGLLLPGSGTKTLAVVVNETLEAASDDLEDESFVTENLACLLIEGNKVGIGGWGKQLASEATALKLLSPEDAVIRNHTSTHVLGGDLGIQVAIVDMFNQTVAAGNLDAERAVTALSLSVTGETIARAEKGVAKFTGLIGFDASGTRSVSFTSEGLVSTTMTVEIRNCSVGEEAEISGKSCHRCSTNFYTFRPEQNCLQCPEHAICSGGAALVPSEGFWHSTPYSPNILECIVRDACRYSQRADRLTAFYANISALVPSNMTVLNDEYPQCAKGYQGVLCGSCEPGFGHIAGGECEECELGRSAVIAIILLFAVWSMLLISFEVFNSILTNREMVVGARNTLTAIHVPPRSVETDGDGANMRSRTDGVVVPYERLSANGLRKASSDKVVGSLRQPETHAAAAADRTDTLRRQSAQLEDFWRRQKNTFLQSLNRGDSSLPYVEVEDMTLSEHIVAAENVTETVKIMTNFLQVTSVAVSVNLGWQKVVEVMLAVQEIIAGISNGTKLVPFDCALSDSGSTPKSVRALWLRVFFPVMLLGVYWLICLAAWLAIRSKQKKKQAYYRVTYKTLFTYIIIVTITVVFFAYNSVTEELMRTVNCINADEEEQVSDQVFAEFVGEVDVEYWAEDTALRCFEGDHTSTGIVGAIGLAIFSAGFVAFIILWLGAHQHKLNHPQFITRYGFIYRAYRTGKAGCIEGAIARELAKRRNGADRYNRGVGGGPSFALLKKLPVYWEAVITLRKGLISAAVVFAYTLGANLQGVLALGVLILAMALQLLFRPFRRFPCFNTRRGYANKQKTFDDYIDLNLLESSSLFVSTVTFYSGIVFNDPNVSVAGTTTMAIFVVTVNVVLLAYFVYRIYEGTHVLMDLKLNDLAVPFSPDGWLVKKFLRLIWAYISRPVNQDWGQGRNAPSYPSFDNLESGELDYRSTLGSTELDYRRTGTGLVELSPVIESPVKPGVSGTAASDTPREPPPPTVESLDASEPIASERLTGAPQKKILDLRT